MDYTLTSGEIQAESVQKTEFLQIPSLLFGFHNTETVKKKACSGRNIYCFMGKLDLPEDDRICTCGCRMIVNNTFTTELRHLNIGSTLSRVIFPRIQLLCPSCKKTRMQTVLFKAERHRITQQLERYARDLLEHGTYTLKDVAYITGLGKNVVKDIDKERLQEKYTIGGKELKRPEKPAKYLGIDEFKLHNGRRYATHIIDLETGHVLWIAKGKSKQVVYDFIAHVGMDWMENVEAVACDMNADFADAFEEKCPWLQPVFDHFHIVKNFNDKVVSEIRKDEQRRLIDEGDVEAARALKKTKYILMSNRATLQKKDQEAAESRIIHRGSPLFGTDNILRAGGQEAKYDALLKENRLLFTCDLVKEKLAHAYTLTDEIAMAQEISDIMDICEASGNGHLLWFRRLLDTHFEGIIAHATFFISSGKVEGINQKIKNVRRHGYGYPDDEYFFLKVIDASHQAYDHNPLSHKICD